MTTTIRRLDSLTRDELWDLSDAIRAAWEARSNMVIDGVARRDDASAAIRNNDPDTYLAIADRADADYLAHITLTRSDISTVVTSMSRWNVHFDGVMIGWVTRFDGTGPWDGTFIHADPTRFEGIRSSANGSTRMEAAEELVNDIAIRGLHGLSR